MTNRTPSYTLETARRIALMGDTHDTIVGSEVFDLLRPHLSGVDLILHCGDLSTLASLDHLTELAPTLAVRSTTDPDPAPPALVEGPRDVVVAGGCRIELRNKLADEEIIGREDADLVVFSAHQPRLQTVGKTIFVSPGSPSLSETPTMAILDLNDGRPTVHFVFLAPG